MGLKNSRKFETPWQEVQVNGKSFLWQTKSRRKGEELGPQNCNLSIRPLEEGSEVILLVKLRAVSWNAADPESNHPKVNSEGVQSLIQACLQAGWDPAKPGTTKCPPGGRVTDYEIL